MKRSGFIKRGKPLLRRGGRIKPGKRMKKWNQVSQTVRSELDRRGINYCEFAGYIEHDCNGFLAPVHARKRSGGRITLDDDEQWKKCALGCQNIGQKLDDRRYFSSEQMERVVEEAIARR